MDCIHTLANALGAHGQALLQHAEQIAEIRIRAQQPLRFRLLDGGEITENPVSSSELQAITARLMEDSLYALEQELCRGYFTIAGGCRIGICGKINAGENHIQSVANISSLCIRIPRQIYNCSDVVLDQIRQSGIGSVLIVSPPGIGKTTLLRDLIRALSAEGYNIGLADERREIAACREGIPQLDVGPRTDVMDGCPKHIALPMLLRACAPDILAADEIGCEADVEALMDAKRCGVRVLATVHADGLESICQRKYIKKLILSGIFRYVVQLGPIPGRIHAIKEIVNEDMDDAKGNFAFVDPDFLHGSRPHAFIRQKTTV